MPSVSIFLLEIFYVIKLQVTMTMPSQTHSLHKSPTVILWAHSTWTHITTYEWLLMAGRWEAGVHLSWTSPSPLQTFTSHRDTSSPRPAINPTTWRGFCRRPQARGSSGAVGECWRKPYLDRAGRPGAQQPAVAGLHRAAPVLGELLRAGPALARCPQHHGAPTHHLA